MNVSHTLSERSAQSGVYNGSRKRTLSNVSIMLPQVITVQELLWVKKYIKDPSVKLGVMVETVRVCMCVN